MTFGARETNSVVCQSEDGGTLELCHSNRGDPYRDGGNFELRFKGESWESDNSIWIERYELEQLHKKITEILAKK